MAQGAHAADSLGEKLSLFRRLEEAGMNQLDRDVGVALLIASAKDEAERTGSKHILHHVTLSDDRARFVGSAQDRALTRALVRKRSGRLPQAAGAERLPARAAGVGRFRDMTAAAITKQGNSNALDPGGQRSRRFQSGLALSIAPSLRSSSRLSSGGA